MSARQQKAATPIVRTLRSDMSGLLDKVAELVTAAHAWSQLPHPA
jgi:hypothetical protein